MAERTVNHRQLEVLRWIVAGCPDGVMEDITYKTTAVALRNRRLVKVSKRKGTWAAEATDAGRHFIEHGTYPDGHWHTDGPSATAVSASTASPQRTTPPARRHRVTGQRPVDQMLADVAAAGTDGFVINDRDRGYFHNLIRSAEQFGKVPEGRQLRIERNQANRTVIRLVDQSAWTKGALIPIPVAERLTKPHPVVLALRDAKHPSGMRGEVRNRALRLLDALAKEAERRGYRVTAPAPEPGRRAGRGHLEITITGHSYAVAVDELNDRVPHQATERELREQERYSRTRIPTHDQVPSGRLRLRILGWSPHQDTFKDTKTIDLATRLPAVLLGIEIRAAEDEERRLQREREAAERQQNWERVRDQAVIALREDHRAKVLLQQVSQWRQAQELDEYLAALRVQIASLPEAEAEAPRSWLDWAQEYRRQLDPLDRTIAIPADPEPTGEALKPFMRGLSPHGPRDW